MQRPLPPNALAALHSVADVCAVLRAWNRPDLADRLAYFASDEDLDDGDQPLTLESARGFLAFFGEVESEGKVSLTCSPEGWILAVWRFPDTRRISLWFMDYDTVIYAARKSDGFFADLNGGKEVGSRSSVMEKMVAGKEWFTWFTDKLVATNSPKLTT